MKEGIGVVAASPRNAGAALECYDAGLELRRRLPIDVAAYAYGLAACWLNRADALTHLGEKAHRDLARQACDEAIALLRALPWRDDARFAKRLAIALQNRALAL